MPATRSRRSATARAVAAAGLFSWWVSPADNWPSASSFSRWPMIWRCSQAADHMSFEQMHGHRELSLHEAGERVRVQHEEP